MICENVGSGQGKVGCAGQLLSVYVNGLHLKIGNFKVLEKKCGIMGGRMPRKFCIFSYYHKGIQDRGYIAPWSECFPASRKPGLGFQHHIKPV